MIMEGADQERLLNRYLTVQDEGSLYTSDGTLDINRQPALKRSTGNWRACFWILGVEFTEYLAFFGISKNLVTYLTSVLHETNVGAARNVSTWMGTCFFTPIIGAYLADTFWGRYWTIVVSLSVYAVGMLALTASASLAMFKDSSDSSSTHAVAVYTGLYLIALGSGGIKPCTSAFGADQFDSADPVERLTKSSFFNWYFFAINLGSLLSGTVLVWVQSSVGWGIGFAIPTLFQVLGLAVLVAGRKVYRYKKLGGGGSPLTRLLQVVVAAARNYDLVLPEDCSALHELPSRTDGNRRTEHTCQFRFLDKAAVAVPWPGERGPWRLCTVSQVEELKMFLRMLPVLASMFVFFAVTAQASSTFVEQGMAMDNRLGPFAVPPAALATFEVASVIVCIPLYDAVLVPLARRATGKDRGLPQLQRLGVGLALSAVAMVYAALVEARRLEVARPTSAGGQAQPSSQMSIMWQAPAFAVLGVAAVFTSIGAVEFFYDQSPDGMKSLGTCLAHLAVSGGSYLNAGILGAVAWATARGGAPGWIPDNLNQGHLDYFFWLLAALSVVNLLHFLHCAKKYRGNKTAF